MEANKFASRDEYEAKKKELEGVIQPIFAKYGGDAAGGMPGGMPGGFPGGAGGFPGGAGFPGAGAGAAPAAGPAVDDLDWLCD